MQDHEMSDESTALVPQAPEVAVAKPGPIARAKQYVDRRRLNHDLAKWFTAAKNFKNNGLPEGSPEYIKLYQQSCSRIAQHASTWNIPSDSIVVEIPALYTLQKLAHPAPKPARPNPVAWGVMLISVLFILAAVFGAAGGVFQLVEKAIAR